MTVIGNRVYTPLRYPGGKARLASFFKKVIRENGLCDSHYVEPYAGGAGIAISLLLTEYCSHIHLNDISYPLFCFWSSILSNPEYLCRRIRDVCVTPYVWDEQKGVLQRVSEYPIEEVAFAFFFLNRTNRSGIQNGGMIGGRNQDGKWKIDARFNKRELIRRIVSIADYSHRISVYNMDAKDFINNISPSLPKRSLVYFDPPYYMKGRRLYPNYYTENDHSEIATIVQSRVTQPWIVTYDNHPNIEDFYSDRRWLIYCLNHTAGSFRVGNELMFFSDSVRIPEPDFAVVDSNIGE
ncbi:MAG: DNA adenine methylase [Thermodesulfobacteriota bacterium]